MAESETNSPKGDPDPGGDVDTSDSAVPPYEGRKGATEPADAPPSGADANVEGGTGPTRTSGGMAHDDPANTPGGRTASPADERPPETVSVTESGQDYSAQVRPTRRESRRVRTRLRPRPKAPSAKASVPQDRSRAQRTSNKTRRSPPRERWTCPRLDERRGPMRRRWSRRSMGLVMRLSPDLALQVAWSAPTVTEDHIRAGLVAMRSESAGAVKAKMALAWGMSTGFPISAPLEPRCREATKATRLLLGGPLVAPSLPSLDGIGNARMAWRESCRLEACRCQGHLAHEGAGRSKWSLLHRLPTGRRLVFDG